MLYFILGFCYVAWLSLVTMCYLYNCWVIPLRITFPYQTPKNLWKWMLFDYCTDAINLLDTFVIKPRIMYLKDGFWVRDLKLIEINYLKKLQSKVIPNVLFRLDLIKLKITDDCSTCLFHYKLTSNNLNFIVFKINALSNFIKQGF